MEKLADEKAPNERALTEKERPMVRSKRRILSLALPLALVVGALAIAAVLVATRPRIPAEAPAERAWVVESVAAIASRHQPVLTLYGQVVAGREAELRPLTPGRIIAVSDNLVDGGVVRQDESLIVIDPFDYAAAVEELRIQLTGEREQLATDERQLALSKTEVERRRSLAGSGAGSKKALDDAQQMLTDREARIIARRQGVARLEVSLRRAENNLSNTKLSAPFDGFVSDVAVAVGKQVGVNDRIARVIDITRLEVLFYLSDQQYGRLLSAGGLAGRSVTVIWRTGERTSEFAAELDRAQGKINAATGGVSVYGRLLAVPLDTPLRPGAFVEVRLPDRVFEDVIRIPEVAVHNGDTVYVLAGSPEQLRLATRAVSVVGRDGNDLLIQGTFSAEERIVITRFPAMGEGVLVRQPRTAESPPESDGAS